MHRTAIDPLNLILDNASGGRVDTLQPNPQRVIVFAGGDLRTAPSPDSTALVIAADSGYDHAITLGHTVDLLIGDLDSLSEEGLAHAESTGVEIRPHPASKDATDLELALDVALEHGAVVDLYGGEAGRIDHLIGVALELTQSKWVGAELRWHTEGATVQPLLDGGHVHPDAPLGTTVSLIVVTDSVGVTTQGLKWPLADDDLERGTSRGVSNEIERLPASVSLDSGAILVITGTGGQS